MSQFEQGARQVNLSRSARGLHGGRTDVPRQDITPGRVFPTRGVPVVSQGARDLSQLVQAIGMVGQTAGAFGGLFRAQAGLQAAENQEQERLLWANAGINANSMLPGRLQDIAERKLLVPDDTTIEAHVTGMLDQELEGVPDVYAQRFRRIMQPELIKAYTKQQASISNEQNIAQIGELGAGMAGVTNRRDFRTAHDTAKSLDPRLTDLAVTKAIGEPAMRAAVATRDQDAFDAAAAYMEPSYPEYVAEQRLRLDTAIEDEANDRQREVNNLLADQVAGGLIPNQDADGNDIPINYAGLIDLIKANGSASPAFKDQQMEKVRDRQAENRARLTGELTRKLIAIASQPNVSIEQLDASFTKLSQQHPLHLDHPLSKPGI